MDKLNIPESKAVPLVANSFKDTLNDRQFPNLGAFGNALSVNLEKSGIQKSLARSIAADTVSTVKTLLPISSVTDRNASTELEMSNVDHAKSDTLEKVKND